MPVEFLSDEEAAAYGAFSGAPSVAKLDRFFLLDDADRELVRRRRGDTYRLGFAVQLGTVRFLGTFLADPLAVPWSVPEYVARHLGITDPSVVKVYGTRASTQWEHTAEIRTAYGYVDFGAREARLREFLLARAWTRPERPTAVFDQAVAWLRRCRVLLPGVSVLARFVSQVRAESASRLYSTIADGVDPELGKRLSALLTVPAGCRVSELERLRKAPARASGPEMVRALDRASEIIGLGVGAIDLSRVPAGRLGLLARQGLSTDAAMLRRLPAARRTATLVAVVGALTVTAVDDVLDLFAVLMATKLIGRADRASVRDRLRSLPRLTRASATLAAATRVLLDLVEEGSEDDGAGADPGQLWQKLNGMISRDGLAAAVAVIAELISDNGEDADRGRRVELVKRYATVRPFLLMLPQVLPLDSSDAGRPVLTAVRGLGELVGRKRVRRDELIDSVVTGSWKALVYDNPDLPAGSVDYRAYALCVLEAGPAHLPTPPRGLRDRFAAVGRPTVAAVGRRRVGRCARPGTRRVAAR